MAIKRRILMVTYPRSGHNFLEQCLRKALGKRAFYYCEQYSFCRTVPCTCEHFKSFQKTHDFNLNDRLGDGWDLLLQYRHPYESISSYYQFDLHHKNLSIDSYKAWSRVLDNKLMFWMKFMDKWWPGPENTALSLTENKISWLSLSYMDLVSDVPKNVLAVLEFAGIADQADMGELKALQAKAPRDIKTFKYYRREDLEKVECKCENYFKAMGISSLL